MNSAWSIYNNMCGLVFRWNCNWSYHYNNGLLQPANYNSANAELRLVQRKRERCSACNLQRARGKWKSVVTSQSIFPGIINPVNTVILPVLGPILLNSQLGPFSQINLLRHSMYSHTTVPKLNEEMEAPQ